MEYETIEMLYDDQVAFLYLNRPEVLNALNEKMKGELMHALHETEKDDRVRVLVLSGRGRGFSSGADLKAFLEAQKSEHERRSRFGSVDFHRAFAQYPKPIIAAINGPAYGFGLTITLICDIRLASDRAKFSCAFVRLGLTQELCSSYFLPRLIGYGKTAELIFTARPFDAAEALELGIVNRVVPHDHLMAQTKELADQIASMPPGAVKDAKQLLRHGMHSTLEQVIQNEAMVFVSRMESEEHRSALERLLTEMNSKKAKE